jgi:hypothetical protein
MVAGAADDQRGKNGMMGFKQVQPERLILLAYSPFDISALERWRPDRAVLPQGRISGNLNGVG